MAEDERYQPERVVTDLEEGLTITWADGHTSNWDLITIRLACPCADCGERRRRGEEVWPRPGSPRPLDVVDAELVGAYGLTLVWNDAHATGAYSWERLREGCPCSECRAERFGSARRNPLNG